MSKPKLLNTRECKAGCFVARWVGCDESSDEHLVLEAGDVLNTRSGRRRPESEHVHPGDQIALRMSSVPTKRDCYRDTAPPNLEAVQSGVFMLLPPSTPIKQAESERSHDFRHPVACEKRRDNLAVPQKCGIEFYGMTKRKV